MPQLMVVKIGAVDDDVKRHVQYNEEN